MAAFSITEAAKSAIHAELESSTLPRPAVSLLDSSQGFLLSPEMEKAITDEMSESEVLAMAKKEYNDIASKIDFRLDVGIYPAHECRPQDLVIIDGFQFAMPKELREFFGGYVLDHEEGFFVLKNGRRTFYRLSDLNSVESSGI